MPSNLQSSRAIALTVALLSALVAACAPERIPGSTVDQGDAGLSFVNARATAGGSAARVGPNSSGASYGGGSSGSSLTGSGAAGGSAGSAAGCGWYGSSGRERGANHKCPGAGDSR